MAVNDKLSRTMHYHRFSWEQIGDEELPTITLQTILNEILKKFKTTKARTIEWDGKEGYVAKSYNYNVKINPKMKKQVLCLHIVIYEPLSTANIIPVPSDVVNVEVNSVLPPEKNNWMDGGACILICDDDVLTCPCSIGCSTAFHYLRFLIHTKKQLNPSCMRLMPTADEDKINLINSEGIDHINLSLNLYKATLEYNKQERLKDKFTNVISETIKSILSKDDKETKDLNDIANIKVGLTLNVNKKEKEISSKQLSELGRTLINDDDDGYSIKTLAGNTITYDNLKIKKAVKLKRRGKTIDRISAWTALKEYYKELNKCGIIEK